MNKQRRDRLREAIKQLRNASTIVDEVYNKEEDSLDNIPENLQTSERFEKMENAVDNLNEAIERIDEARELVEMALV